MPVSMAVFPDRTSVIRLAGAVLAEQHDEWAEGRRYLGLDGLTRARAVPGGEEVTDPEPQALTAWPNPWEGSHLIHHASGLGP